MVKDNSYFQPHPWRDGAGDLSHQPLSRIRPWGALVHRPHNRAWPTGSAALLSMGSPRSEARSTGSGHSHRVRVQSGTKQATVGKAEQLLRLAMDAGELLVRTCQQLPSFSGERENY